MCLGQNQIWLRTPVILFLANSPRSYMDIPSRFIIHESPRWIVNHRMDSALPHYLMLSARQMTNLLAALPAQALAASGLLLGLKRLHIWTYSA